MQKNRAKDYCESMRPAARRDRLGCTCSAQITVGVDAAEHQYSEDRQAVHLLLVGPHLLTEDRR